MNISSVLILSFVIKIKGIDFNGGTITWTSIDPYTNSSTVVVTITQTYTRLSSNANRDKNAPISAPIWSNDNVNLTCIENCWNDIGYSSTTVDILTNCVSSNSSLNIMKIQRSKNVTLHTDASFSIAYKDHSWRSLDSSFSSTDQTSSLTSLIDLRRRPDGTINSPPISNIPSLHSVIVNQTTQIRIPVHDINQNDFIRCRWAQKNRSYSSSLRNRSSSSSSIDECGGICFPFGLPPNTTLTDDCLLTITATQANQYYAVALQIEDFVNETSEIAMSSIPVQFLIHASPLPKCSSKPSINVSEECTSYQTGLSIDLRLDVKHYCYSSESVIDKICFSKQTSSMKISKIDHYVLDDSIYYVTLNWIPQTNPNDSHEFCAIAYTNENIASGQYCTKYIIKNETHLCQVPATPGTVSMSTTETTRIVSMSTTETTRLSQTRTTTVMREESKKENELNIGLIIGLSILGLFLLFCCCCGCVWYYLH